MTICLILAAGRSSRMGRPKSSLMIDGVPLLFRLIRAARAADLEPLVLYGEHVWSAMADRARWIQVPGWADGMGATIAGGVAALPPDASRCVIAPVDMPTIDADQLRALAAVDTPVGASVLPNGRIGAPASFAATCFPALRALRGDRGARDLIRGGQWPVTRVVPAVPLIDIDTPTEWAAFADSEEVPCV